MISPATIERIKDIPVADVIRHYVDDLKPNGKNYKALSPFTTEKTPSFHVSVVKNIFKCFSSGHGGDGIAFVMALNKCSFVDAIKDIAGKVGEQIEWEVSDKPNEDQAAKEELYKIIAYAESKFASTLLDTDGTHWAFNYLIGKLRYSGDTIAQWQIGYAPGPASGSDSGSGWQFLTNILKEKALIKPAVELGLVREKDGRHYDAFRDRIIFPIHDHQGRVVGFGGRAQHEDEHTPKYLNSSESPVFNKSGVLFGLNHAGRAIRANGFANLMEGYTDVISFHQANYNNSVGSCGTALTEQHCRLLKKYCSKVVLFPDPDKAGEKSAVRSIDLLMTEGFDVNVVPMPKVEGKKIDPDELTRLLPIKNVTT